MIVQSINAAMLCSFTIGIEEEFDSFWSVFVMTRGKKATIHQVTTMLATSKNVVYPGHNHLLTTGADDPTHYHPSASEGDNQKGHQHRWLAGGYDLEIGHF